MRSRGQTSSFSASLLAAAELAIGGTEADARRVNGPDCGRRAPPGQCSGQDRPGKNALVALSTRFVEPIAVDLPRAELVSRLARALAGDGPALLPIGGNSGALLESARLDDPVCPDTALLLPTSGSTGAPKVVELSAAALSASAHATHERIGPAGRWLLALPLTHIAGWQVLVRGLLSDTPHPAELDPREPFTASAFRQAVEQNPDVCYTSLVPTQLGRLLEDPAAVDAMRHVTVLLGGAAASPEQLTRAAEQGLTVVTTYGSSETSGGCVYDGVPLTGVQAKLTADGRVALAGPMLATGYRGRPDDPAFEQDAEGRRWFVTSDLAEMSTHPDTSVSILGRADDVIVTGGEKVHPAEVERALARLTTMEVIVVGVPDPEWGQRITVVTTDRTADLTVWRTELRSTLPAYALPRSIAVVEAVPQLGIGKPDRAAAAALARDRLG